jgi:hypothetical protein
MAPVLTSSEAMWATRFAIFDLGLDSAARATLTDLILEKEAGYDSNLSQRKQAGLFPPFSSLYKKQGFELWPEPEFALVREALVAASRSFIDYVLGPDTAILGVDAWANIHRASNWHGPHSHFAGGEETASGVYWIQVPDEPAESDSNGAFVFTDPRGPYHPGRHRKVIRPKAGSALLFPSWQQHYVTPLVPGSLRVSIGFDVLCDQIIP